MDFEDEDLDEDTTYSWVNFKFKTIRVVDNVFTSHVNTLKAEIIMDVEANEVDISMTLEKIHFWFDKIVSNSILFCRDNQFALSVVIDDEGMARTGNIPMVFPTEPSDDFLVRVMHSKLNAFGGDKVAFGMMEVTSDTREQLTCTFTGWGESELPDMEEWIGERAFHEVPWWSRDDGSTLDVIPGEAADLKNPPRIGVDMSFIADRYKTQPDEPAMVIRPQFKPEVISGGKNDPDTKD